MAPSLFSDRSENTNLVEGVVYLLPVKFRRIPFSGFWGGARTYEKFRRTDNILRIIIKMHLSWVYGSRAIKITNITWSSDWEGNDSCAIVPLTWKMAHKSLCRMIRNGPLKFSKSLKKAEKGPFGEILFPITALHQTKYGLEIARTCIFNSTNNRFSWTFQTEFFFNFKDAG